MATAVPSGGPPPRARKNAGGGGGRKLRISFVAPTIALSSLAIVAMGVYSTGRVHLRVLMESELLSPSSSAGGGRGGDAPEEATTRQALGIRASSSDKEDDGGFPAVKSALFNPSQFRTDTYVSLPVAPESSEISSRVEAAEASAPGEPVGLLHEAHPPGNDVIMGLAAYPTNMGGFIQVVSTLRNAGYDGHIILGVHVNIPDNEALFLRNNDVTFYAVEFVDCDAKILDGEKFDGAIRGKCTKGLEDLKVEWGRFEMARQWLAKCKECTGWAMVMDTRDIFFQAHPFKHLPDAKSAKKDLLFVEEIAPYTNPKAEDQPWRASTVDNGRYKGKTEPCYGKGHWKEYADRAILCSGTVIGTGGPKGGMHRFLSVLVDEFRTNNAKSNPKCRSPSTTDQWTMNYLYYTGAFGKYSNTATLPWGTGPVMTIGTPCVNNKIKHSPETPNHSQKDLVEFSKEGLIVNNWEEEGSGFRVAPAVHQEDRCHRWIEPWKKEHKELFDTKGTKEEGVRWKGGAGGGGGGGGGKGTTSEATAVGKEAAAANSDKAAKGGGKVAAAAKADEKETLFTPDIFREGRTLGKWDGYVNLPINSFTSELEKRVTDAMGKDPGEPYGLMHEAHPPGKDVVMGLAAYPRNMGTFKRLAGGLRNVGYDGHIILGVHAKIPQNEQEYLKRMDVTFYSVDMIDCDPSIMDKGAGDGGGNIRGKCSKGLEDLKLEWGRFEMARQWLRKCTECTGWAMVMDTRDIFFQSHPFESLPDAATAEKDLLFVEEISHHTSPRPVEEKHRYYVIDNGRYVGRTEPCYGKGHWHTYRDRPVLCSGTVIGTAGPDGGMHRFLSVLVDEFRSNNKKAEPKCRSPHNTDQWTMDYMYYQGMFGYPAKTATLPWGTGPVLTIGHACINTKLEPNHSQKDLTVFEGGDTTGGWILNNWEADFSTARRAPCVHQHDRCAKWIHPWFGKHNDVYNEEKSLPWKKEL